MNTFCVRFSLILMMGTLVTGCATPIPVATPALRCEASAELLASQCEKPKPLPDDATYETVVDAMREDRQALLECGLKVDALRESINRCNQQAYQLNSKVDEINEKNRNGSN